MQIKIDTNLQQVRRQFAGMARQVDYAAAVALTRTAMDVRSEVQRRLPQIIENPTRWTTNSMFVRKATKQRLESTIYFKGADENDPKANVHYLNALIAGGKRRTKRFEGRLIMHGYINRGEHLVPVPKPDGGAEIDGFGNVNPGQITKILSQLKTAVVSGDYSNASDSKRSSAKRAVEQYFWSGGPGTLITEIRETRDVKGKITRTLVRRKQHLKRGVWVVRRTAFGNSVRIVFRAVSRAKYKKTFDFYGIADSVKARAFGAHFNAEFAKAIATAR